MVQQTMKEAQDPGRGLSLADFSKILARSPLNLEVDLPSDV